jgi:glycosyltransferase involved in cell wall biosynthesis
MRILILAPECPWPVRKGSHARMVEVARKLNRHHAVALVAPDPGGLDPGAVQLGIRIDRVVLAGPGGAGLRRTGTAMLRKALSAVSRRSGGDPISGLRPPPPGLIAAVARAIDGFRPDVVWVNYAKLLPAVPEDYAGKVVVDQHDLQTELALSAEALGLRGEVAEQERFLAAEAGLLLRADAVVAINPREADRTRTLLHWRRPVTTLPVFLPAVEPEAAEEPDLVLFVGSASPFNTDALAWFAEQCWDAVRRSHPQARLAVVGGAARHARTVAALGGRPGVELVGPVDALAPWYGRAAVVVAPLRGGAGMKVKVVEALAHGKALVLTPAAADGIDLRPGTDALVASDPEGFAGAVCALLADPDRRRRIAAAGRSLHRRDHSPEAARRRIEEALFGIPDSRIAAAGNRPPRHRLQALLVTGARRPAARGGLLAAGHLDRHGIRCAFVKATPRRRHWWLHRGFPVHAAIPTDGEWFDRAGKWPEFRAWRSGNDPRLRFHGIDFTGELPPAPDPAAVRHAYAFLLALDDLVFREDPDLLGCWEGPAQRPLHLARVVAAHRRIAALGWARGPVPDMVFVDRLGCGPRSRLAGGACGHAEPGQAAAVERWLAGAAPPWNGQGGTVLWMDDTARDAGPGPAGGLEPWAEAFAAAAGLTLRRWAPAPDGEGALLPADLADVRAVVSAGAPAAIPLLGGAGPLVTPGPCLYSGKGLTIDDADPAVAARRLGAWAGEAAGRRPLALGFLAHLLNEHVLDADPASGLGRRTMAELVGPLLHTGDEAGVLGEQPAEVVRFRTAVQARWLALRDRPPARIAVQVEPGLPADGIRARLAALWDGGPGPAMVEPGQGPGQGLELLVLVVLRPDPELLPAAASEAARRGWTVQVLDEDLDPVAVVEPPGRPRPGARKGP